MDATDALPPLSKRKRLNDTEEPEDKPLTVLRRSSEFWFDDGSIVLQVEKTQFRVHRSILGSNSNFFADMFALPQPTNEETVEGCAVVCMYDTTVDWDNLLMFMYFPARLQKIHSDLPVSFLGSMLRLGKKYQFDLIKDNALSRLKAHVPGSLEAWDAKFNPLHYDDDEDDWSKAIGGMPWLIGREVEVINIALEHGIQSVLPVAYYLSAVTRPIEDILNDAPSADNHDATHLTPESRRVVIAGQDALRHLAANHAAMICSHESIPSNHCDNAQKCAKNFQWMTNCFLHMVGLTDRCRFMLDFWRCIKLSFPFKFCPSCSGYLEAMHERRRMPVWDRLPSLFDLPDWEDLKEFDE